MGHDAPWLDPLLRVVIPLGSLLVAVLAWRASLQNTRTTAARTALQDLQEERDRLQARVTLLEEELSRAQEHIVRLVIEQRGGH